MSVTEAAVDAVAEVAEPEVCRFLLCVSESGIVYGLQKPFVLGCGGCVQSIPPLS